MKNIEIFTGVVTPDEVKNNPNKLYVFEENTTKVGNTGSLAIRNLPNAVGLRVRKGPGTKSAAFFTDVEFENNKKIIIEDIINIKYLSVCYDSIVLSSSCYGSGSTLELRCPNTWKFIVDVLKYNFDFDNSTGKKWQKFPSHHEIVSSDYLKTFLNDDVINPVNNSFFLPHLLQKNLFSSFDLVKTDNKISITTKRNYEIGQNLILQFQSQKKYLVCRVILSYPANSIKKNIWSTFEGVTDDFSKNVDLTNYYQIQIKYICSLDENGNMEFRDDYFTPISPSEKEKIDKKLSEMELNIEKSKNVEFQTNELKKSKKDVEINKISEKKKENYSMKKEVTNEEIYNLLLEINSKLDRKNQKTGLFKKKSLNQLLEEENIFGEIKDINNNNFEIHTEKSIYFVKYKRGFLKNSIEVLLRKDII